ncbi:testis-specific y-encoded protein [Holotrichia oblita]|uniref:Testis-specific y-encoded protein n=1 Tax=Holotrichia oblita TaxID=644536 RepID=A0ACB9TB47_HOLOL|nr:testis-specific y-encoded protein [Holotrichia oblita]
MDKLQTLPAPVKRRIKALKKLQLEATNVEAKFFEEVHDLECKYHKLYSPLYEKRFTILTGAYEPNEDECQWPSDEEEELSKDLDNKAKIEEKKEEAPTSEIPVKGIPEFWLTVFKNVGPLCDMVQEHDEPILKHLVDIKTIFIEKPMGFVLEFHFEANEYFSNTILTKEYDMKCVPDEDDPFSFEGPEIYRCRGCTINWNKGKNDEDFDDEEEEEDDEEDDEEDEDSDNKDNAKIANDKNCKQQ